MIKIYIDWETRGVLDIKKVGAHIYLTHRSTEPLCLAFVYRQGDKLVKRLVPCTPGWQKHPYIQELREFAERDDVIFIAHNAAFEQGAHRRFLIPIGFPELPPRRWRCTMAKCHKHSLPSGLEMACKVMRLKAQKNVAGHKIMMKLSKPRRMTKGNSEMWWTPQAVPDDFKLLYTYCVEDCVAELELDESLADLSDYEQQVWEIDQRINQQGIRIDLQFVTKAMAFAEQQQMEVVEAFRAATDNEVDSPTQRGKLLEWSKSRGFVLLNTQAAVIKQTLARKDVPQDVRKALAVFQQAGNAAFAKYPAFLDRADRKGIIRESLIYHKAHTGRWASWGVQFHNMYRPKIDVEIGCKIITEHSYETFISLYDNAPRAISSCVRGAVIPSPGKRFLGADFSQMESRVLAWLAGEEKKLELFRQGVDVYCVLASTFYGYPVNPVDHPNERQTGKVGDLSLGYQGGTAAFDGMAKNYELDLSPVVGRILSSATHSELKKADYCYKLYLKTERDEYVDRDLGLAEDIIKQRWRAAHPMTVQYWKDLEAAAIKAVQTKSVVQCRGVKWGMSGRFLVCVLPSGRPLYYPYPKVSSGDRGKPALSYAFEFEGKWMRGYTYGGSLAENLTQAVQRDLLVDAIVELEPIYPVTLHVHDEVISEVPLNYGSKDEFEDIMKRHKPWANGIPVAVKGWQGGRYGKK
jgi:DNA polymerase